MSVACLPDNSPATLALFRNHAFAFVTDTRVSWDYDEASATVTTDFEVDTEVKEGTETRPLLALYRHQWLHTDASFPGLFLRFPAGGDEGHRAASFSTTMAYPGIMPVLPAMVEDNPGYDSDLMDGYLDDFLNQSYSQLFYRGDTYFGGKDLGIVSSAIRVADHGGAHRCPRLPADRSEGEAGGLALRLGRAKTQTLFYYNDTWGTMYGFPVLLRNGPAS